MLKMIKDTIEQKKNKQKKFQKKVANTTMVII